MIEPKFRCGTGEAILNLAKKLDVEHNDLMQDWSYEISNPNEINNYIELYEITTDDDEKFVLMEVIIQALEDQEREELFLKYCYLIKDLLKKDFDIHEYTVYYWSCLNTENIEDGFKISGFMREILLMNK